MTDGKVCTKCGQWKPLTEYYKQKTGAGGRRADCITCFCGRAQEHYVANREKILKRNHSWNAANREKTRAYVREYSTANRGERRIQAHCRAARKRARPVHWTRAHMQTALDHFGGACAVCGQQFYDLFGKRRLEWDHWIPLKSPDCPGTVPWNMVPLCGGAGGCNTSKQGRDALEWLTDRYGPRRARALWKQITGWLESQRVNG